MTYRLFGQAKLLSGVFKASVLSFIAIFAFAVYEFILPIFTESQSDSFAIVGIIVSMVYLASFICEIPTGLAVDKYGRIKVILIAMTCLSVLGIIYYLTYNLVFLAFMSVIFGIVSVAFWIPSTVLIRDFSPRKMLSRSQGVYLTITQVGWIAGPMIAGFIAVILSERHNFLFFSALMFAAVIFGLVIFRGKRAEKFRDLEKRHKHKARLTLMVTVLKEYVHVHKHALPTYLLTMSAYIFTAVEWTYVPLASIERFGFTASFAGILLSMMMIVQATLYFTSGYVMDKVDKRYIITGGFFLLFSSTYFMFLAASPAAFIIAALIASASVSWILPGTEALLTEIVPADLYGEMSGAFDTSKDLGLIIGPFVGGMLATYFSNELSPFIFVAVVAALATLLSGYIFWPEYQKKRLQRTKYTYAQNDLSA